MVRAVGKRERVVLLGGAVRSGRVLGVSRVIVGTGVVGFEVSYVDVDDRLLWQSGWSVLPECSGWGMAVVPFSFVVRVWGLVYGAFSGARGWWRGGGPGGGVVVVVVRGRAPHWECGSAASEACPH